MGVNVSRAIGPALGLIRSGKLTALAVTGAEASPLLPGVAPVAQTLPGYRSGTWYALFAPRGTPGEIVSTLSSRISAALAEPAVRDTLLKAGLQPCDPGQAKFVVRIRESEKLWVPVIRSLNIKLD